MRTVLAVGLLALAAAARAQTDADRKADKGDKPDVKKLLGTWTITAGEKEGAKVADGRIAGNTVRITEDTITVTDKDNKQVYLTQYKLDAGKSPWGITMTVPEGEMKGATAVGIVRLDGDELKLCYSLAGGVPPTEFATTAGSKQLLFVMKRAK